MKSLIKKAMRSLRFRMTACMVLIVVIVLFLVMQYNFSAISDTKKDMADIWDQRLNVRLAEVERDLENVEDFLKSSKDLREEYEQLSALQDGGEDMVVRESLQQEFESAFDQYEYIDGFYLYCAQKDIFLSAARNHRNTGMPEELREAVVQLINGYEEYSPEDREKWLYLTVNGEDCFVRVLENYGMYMGALVKRETLEEWINPEKIGGAQMQLFNERRDEVTVARRRFRIADFDLIIYEKTTFDISDLKEYWQWFLISIAALFLFVIFIRCFFHYEIIRPLNRFVYIMDQPDERRKELLKEPASCDEFQTIYDAMGEMIERIQGLDRQIYEEQLQRREVSIQYLQLQINPHFLINCMNLIRNLVCMGREKEVEKVVVELGNYMRYTMRNVHTVTLEEELRHVATYIYLQKFRYEEYLEYTEEIREDVKQYRIPVMLMQTFVENAVKHGGNYENILRIVISAECSGDRLCIKIEDNGDGFSEEILRKLQEGESVYNDLGEHVGILNVCRRLELLYKEKAHISFYNREEGGAGIEIVIPADIPGAESGLFP